MFKEFIKRSRKLKNNARCQVLPPLRDRLSSTLTRKLFSDLLKTAFLRNIKPEKGVRNLPKITWQLRSSEGHRLPEVCR